MRLFALTVSAVTLALVGCHAVVGPRGVDQDAPRPVSHSLHAALQPAIDRAVTGPGWSPEYLDRGDGGGTTKVLLNETIDRKYTAVFRCRRGGEAGEAVALRPADGRRILTALHWDLHAVVLREEADVTHSKVTDTTFEIDYRRGPGGGTIRATLAGESAPEGMPSEYTRLEVALSEKARHRVGVQFSGPLVWLLGRAME